MKKILSLLLCVLMIGLVFGSCKPKKSGPGEETGKKPDSTTNNDINGIPSAIPEDLVFNNEDVNILLRTDLASEFTIEDIAKNGVEEAIFERNHFVEDRLGIRLNFVISSANPENEYLTEIRKLYTSGFTASEGGYHFVTSHVYYGAALAAEGTYLNLLNFDLDNYIDTSKPWYNQSFVTENVLNDALYFTVGDVNLSATDRTVVTFMNKDKADAYGIGDIDYIQVVKDGMWTLDYLKTLIADIYDDNTGDGKTLDDFYGLTIMRGSANIDSLLISCGMQLAKRTDEGALELTVNSPANENVYAKLYDFFYTEVPGIKVCSPKQIVGNEDDYKGKDFKYMSDQKFFDGQTVFAFGLLQSAKVFAQTKLSYQILPLPKLDENMEGYRTSPQDSYNLVSVMSNCKGNDLALATATLECLSEQSYRLVRPEYYDIAFKIRYASEEDTAALFDMIIDNIRYEFAFVNSALIGDVLHRVRDNFIGYPNPETSLGKIWAEYGSSVSTAFEELIENYGSYNSSDRKE